MNRRSLLRAAGLSAGLALVPQLRGASAQAQEPTQTTSQYFAETGHNLKSPFLDRGKVAGGKDGLGAPLSEERYAEGAGGVLQTFEGMTLIYDPSLEAPWDVQGAHLPAQLGRDLAPGSARRQVNGCSVASRSCRFFSETGHTLSGRIAEFWNEHGDLPTFGLPLSEPFNDQTAGVTAQLFERALLEDHGSKGIKVRALGRAQAESADLLGSDPAFLPAPPTGGKASLVHASDGLRLRDGPDLDAEILAVLPDNAEFIAAPGGKGAWRPGYADGYAGWVSADFLKDPPPLPPLSLVDWNPKVWQGAALSDTNLRAKPTTQSEVVKVLAYGEAVTIVDWVKGEEVFEGADMWAKTDRGQYIYSRNVGRNAPVLPTPLPPDAPGTGKWIDVDLVQQLMTAYSGRNAVRTVPTTTGMAGWETPTGRFQILTRVPNETMSSGSIGAEHYFKLDDVLFTQYFTNQGHAIHFAWWRTAETIGRPGSHGCLNLLLDDARFFWDWAEIGTTIVIH
jgi:hypothetical protein